MPWPKGRPMSPETRAKLMAGNRMAIDSRTPEERAERSRRHAAAMRRVWAEAAPEVREAWRLASAASLTKARAAIPSVLEASQKGNAAKRLIAEAKAAADEAAGIAHLSRGQRKDYWLFRSKEFNHDEALSLVETGMLPR